jgi:non-specific serine/threonine protein kinase/serine/threonine-protein kinase
MVDPENLESVELPRTAIEPSSVETIARIGPYHLLERIGQGGMGEVFLAEQREPVRRKVALKVIKQGMDTKQVVARFEAERQALAMMDHAVIAKVFDAGATPEGRPYFVMELVQGVPITEYCDRHKLTNRERLELFIRVCEGVQHAHQKAVIHRDLKPSNILVSVRNDRPAPKIIDFGVAKATAQKLTDQTMHTQMGVLIGTPEYMSPEQAELGVQDIDTRTDVYALGVVLYELLVGAMPFDSNEFQKLGLDTVVRKIREEEPPKPSTRLTTLGEHSAESARRRGTELSALRRELSGDLDWITMKALEKDRTRRYGSPHEFAADVERYLTHQPVLASPPSTAYRARKFVRRHAGAVAAATAGLLMLVTFTVVLAVQAGRIAAERDRANREAEAKGEVSRFLKGVFKVSNPGEARGSSITARELLDKGAERIEGMEQPETRAGLMRTIGDVYHNLGLYEEAEPLLEKSLAEYRRLFGDDDPRTLGSMNNLAIVYFAQGHYDEAEPLYLEHREASKRLLGDDDAQTLSSTNNLANLYKIQGRYDEAEPLLVETLEIRKHAFGIEHPGTLVAMNNLASLYETQGRLDEAEPLMLEALEAQRSALGDDHPNTLAFMNNLAILYDDQDRYDEAEPLYVEMLETQRRVLGDDHPDTLRTLGNLAQHYQGQELWDKAERFSIEALEAQERVLGPEHPSTAITIHNLACLYRDIGRHEESQSLFERVLKIDEKTLGPDHPYVADDLDEYAELLRRTGDDAGAERLEERARAIREP